MIDSSDASGHSQPKKVGNARYYGYLPDLLREMSTMMNFRYELYTVPDGSYGYRISAGKWSGLIGELTKGVRETQALYSTLLISCI